MKSHSRATEQEILERAEQLLAEAPLESMLEFLSPERIARGASFSPAAVRYHFGEDGRKFSIAKLSRALVARMIAANRKAAKVAVSGYRFAALGVRDFADADKVIEGILADVGQYYGPILEEEAGIAARERVYLLTVLTAERDGESAQALLGAEDEILDEYEKIYDLYLEKTKRKLVDCISTRDLAMVVTSLLFGATLVGRYKRDFEMELIAKTVVRIFWAFTYDPTRQSESLYKTDVGG